MQAVPAVDAVRGLVPRIASTLRADPLLAAAAAGVGLLIVILLVVLIRRWRRTHGERFLQVLAAPEAITVLMHPNPDPDAMAAALGVAHLAEQVETVATIQYAGEISHQENRAFRTVLDCDFGAIESADDLAQGAIVLVDHNEPRGFAGCEMVDPYAVVDHHPGSGAGATFTDVRPEYGACASIVAEYYEGIGVAPIPPDIDPGVVDESGHVVLPSLVATGLLYGILADTGHLTRGCSPAEFDAARYLSTGVDGDVLDRIANPPVDADVLDTIAAAIEERSVRPPFVVSDVGTVSNVDAIPQAADQLMKLEGVTAVVVIGDADDTLHLSGRSRDDRVHMGDALAAAVSDIPMSGAGGHARMGGGQVSIAHMEGLRSESGLSRRDLIERLFAAMGGDAQAISAGRA